MASEEDDYISEDEEYDDEVEVLFLARVAYPFQGTCDVELTLQKDDVVSVFRTDVGGGWWEGERDGQRGLFPSSYCKKIDDAVTVTADSDAGTSATPTPQPRSRAAPKTAAAASTGSTHKRTPSATALEVSSSPDLRYTIEDGARWAFMAEPFHVRAKTNPNKGSKFSGIKQFTTYEITSSTTTTPVNRRFKHFTWLQQRLSELFPGINIPPLPEKQLQGRFDAKFVEQRRRQLERFLNRVAAHPVLGTSSVFHHFLTTTDQKEWKSGKRAAEKNASSFLANIGLPKADAPTDEPDAVMQKFSKFTSWLEKHTGQLLKTCEDLAARNTGAAEEMCRMAETVRKLAESGSKAGTFQWWSEGSSEFKTLLKSLETFGVGFERLGALVQQQLDDEVQILHDVLKEYTGVLHTFPQMVKVFEAAHHGASSSQPDQIEAARQKFRQVSFVTLAEVRHFHEQLVHDWDAMARQYVQAQIDYHKKAAAVWSDLAKSMGGKP